MMKPSTFGFLVVRGVRNLGKHWAMTIACIASLSVCMTLNTFATLAIWASRTRWWSMWIPKPTMPPSSR